MGKTGGTAVDSKTNSIMDNVWLSVCTVIQCGYTWCLHQMTCLMVHHYNFNVSNQFSVINVHDYDESMIMR